MNFRNNQVTILRCGLREAGVIGFSAMILLIIASPARATTSYIINGGFETTTNGDGQLGFNTNVTNWSVPSPSGGGSYTFLFTPGSADTTGVTGQYGNLMLWGPNDGSANGLPATSPDGGNYLALDADFQPGALSQTITGLTPGDEYVLGFWWAATQQQDFDGATTQQLQVSFGSDPSQSTAVYDLPNHGFSGWMYQTFDFTATGVSQVLSFLAVGNPAVPPFTLLDGVSFTAAPEPGTLILILSGLGLMVGLGVLRSNKVV